MTTLNKNEAIYIYIKELERRLTRVCKDHASPMRKFFTTALHAVAIMSYVTTLLYVLYICMGNPIDITILVCACLNNVVTMALCCISAWLPLSNASMIHYTLVDAKRELEQIFKTIDTTDELSHVLADICIDANTIKVIGKSMKTPDAESKAKSLKFVTTASFMYGMMQSILSEINTGQYKDHIYTERIIRYIKQDLNVQKQAVMITEIENFMSVNTNKDITELTLKSVLNMYAHRVCIRLDINLTPSPVEILSKRGLTNLFYLVMIELSSYKNELIHYGINMKGYKDGR